MSFCFWYFGTVVGMLSVVRCLLVASCQGRLKVVVWCVVLGSWIEKRS